MRQRRTWSSGMLAVTPAGPRPMTLVAEEETSTATWREPVPSPDVRFKGEYAAARRRRPEPRTSEAASKRTLEVTFAKLETLKVEYARPDCPVGAQTTDPR